MQVDLAGRTPTLEVATAGPQTPLELAASVANAAPGHHHHSTSSAAHQDSAGVSLRQYFCSTFVVHAELLKPILMITMLPSNNSDCHIQASSSINIRFSSLHAQHDCHILPQVTQCV